MVDAERFETLVIACQLANAHADKTALAVEAAKKENTAALESEAWARKNLDEYVHGLVFGA